MTTVETARGRLGTPTRRLPVRYVPVLVTLSLVVAMFTAGSLHYPYFGTGQVFLNLFVDNSFLLVAVVGMTFVILTGGIDLSVGSVVALSTLLCAELAGHGWPPYVVFPLVLLVGATLGLSMGSIIHYFEIQPFIVTLAGMFLARGLCYAITVDAISITDPSFTRIAGWSLALPWELFLTMGAVVSLVVVAIGLYLLHLTSFGQGQRCQPGQLGLDRRRRHHVPVDQLRLLMLEAEVDGGQGGDGAGNTDKLVARDAVRQHRRHLGPQCCQLGGGGRIRCQMPLGHAHAAHVEADRESDPIAVTGHQLGAAAADVADDEWAVRLARGGHAAQGHARLLLARQQPCAHAALALQPPQELPAVACVANGAGGDQQRPIRVQLARPCRIAGDALEHPPHRRLRQLAARVDAIAEPGDPQQPLDLGDRPAGDVGHQQPGRVGAHVNRGDPAAHLLEKNPRAVAT